MELKASEMYFSLQNRINLWSCAIWGCRCGVNENCVLLGCDAAYVGSFLHRHFGTTYWPHIQGSISNRRHIQDHYFILQPSVVIACRGRLSS